MSAQKDFRLGNSLLKPGTILIHQILNSLNGFVDGVYPECVFIERRGLFNVFLLMNAGRKEKT